jgi:hypothetical protein
MKRFSGHTEPWGDFVDIKTNAPAVLERQLKRLRHKINDIGFQHMVPCKFAFGCG